MQKLWTLRENYDSRWYVNGGLGKARFLLISGTGIIGFKDSKELWNRCEIQTTPLRCLLLLFIVLSHHHVSVFSLSTGNTDLWKLNCKGVSIPTNWNSFVKSLLKLWIQNWAFYSNLKLKSNSSFFFSSPPLRIRLTLHRRAKDPNIGILCSQSSSLPQSITTSSVHVYERYFL